jgi:hypothetical protein
LLVDFHSLKTLVLTLVFLFPFDIPRAHAMAEPMAPKNGIVTPDSEKAGEKAFMEHQRTNDTGSSSTDPDDDKVGN